MSSCNPENALSTEIDHLIKNIESLPNEIVQRLFASVLKLYVSRLSDDPQMLPFANDTVITATEAAIAASRILKQVNVEVFELAMWQTMGSVR